MKLYSAFFIFIALLLYPNLGRAQLQVTVVDEHGHELQNVVVQVSPEGALGTSNEAGTLTFENIAHGPISIRLSILGFQVQVIDTIYKGQMLVTARLSSTDYELGPVEISRDRIDNHGSASTAYIDAKDLTENQEISFAATLNQQAGVQSINTGVGISKPVIRGLSSNRIAVNQGGLRQEGQQWGQDHGLEIDVFDVSGVELIKGASALQYGSDATGGVINLLPFTIPSYNSATFEISSVYNSNNHLLGTSLLAASNANNWVVSARYSKQRYGDYSVPADSFTYNGFVFPLAESSLKNTAGKEENYRIGLARKHLHGITRFNYSRYHLYAGFFSGAVGIPKSYLLEPDGNTRDIDLPYQEVIHDKILLNHTQVLDNGEWMLDLGYQSNQRAEHSYPEFHNLPPDAANFTLGQFFRLNTYSLRSQYQWGSNDSFHQTFGVRWQSQQNRIDGFDYLLPDFSTQRLGAYYLIATTTKKNWKWNAGLRIDQGKNKVLSNRRYLYNNAGQVLDSLLYEGYEQTYGNVSASLGFRKEIARMVWKANASRSYRIPYPNETSSNGVHHGTFRHEQGTSDLRAETGYHLETALEYQKEEIQMEAALFGSFYNDYIYLSPSATFSRLPEAGQVYKYVQYDAIFWGLEFQHQVPLSKSFEFSQSIEYVWNYNLNTGLGFPFSPPFHVLSKLTWNKKEWKIGVSHETVARQNRTDRNELSTPGYQLVHASVGNTISLKSIQIRWQLRVQNLGNRVYLNHLSRYRILNLPEQGRNVSLHLKVPMFINW